MSTKTDRIKDAQAALIEQEDAERARSMSTRGKPRGDLVMMDNMTGKPIPDTFVTANDRRNIERGSSTPASNTTERRSSIPASNSTPASILKKGNSSASTKTSDSSTKDVRFTTPERGGASGSQTNDGATSDRQRSSSKPSASRTNADSAADNDRKTSTSTNPLEDVTPPREDTPRSIPSSIDTSPSVTTRTREQPTIPSRAKNGRSMNDWDASLGDYLFSPPGPDDKVPFKDFSFGGQYSAGKIDKIIQDPYLDVIKDDPEAVKEELEDILGDKVTRYRDAPPIGEELHSVEVNPDDINPEDDECSIVYFQSISS